MEHVWLGGAREAWGWRVSPAAAARLCRVWAKNGVILQAMIGKCMHFNPCLRRRAGSAAAAPCRLRERTSILCCCAWHELNNATEHLVLGLACSCHKAAGQWRRIRRTESSNASACSKWCLALPVSARSAQGQAALHGQCIK